MVLDGSAMVSKPPAGQWQPSPRDQGCPSEDRGCRSEFRCRDPSFLWTLDFLEAPTEASTKGLKVHAFASQVLNYIYITYNKYR